MKKKKDISSISMSDIDGESNLENLFEDVQTEELAPKEEVQPRKKKKKPLWLIILIGILVAGFIGFSIYGYTQNQNRLQAKYDIATTSFNSGDYEEARNQFLSLSEFKDSQEMADSCTEKLNEIDYTAAMELKTEGKYTEAIEAFENIKDYKDSELQARDSSIVRRKLYIEYIGLEVYKINKYKELAVAMTEIVARDWKLASDTGKDTNAALQQTYVTWADNIKRLNIGADGLKTQVEAIEELEGTEKAFNNLKELYDMYVKINEQAVKPTGELMSYQKKVTDLSNSFDSLMEKLFVGEPEARAIFNKEVQKAIQEEINNAQSVINQQ